MANANAKPNFLTRKGVDFKPKTYFVDAMGAMAFGLFASLLIGTIFGTLADWVSSSFFESMSKYCVQATGAAIGIAIAYSLKAPPLVLYSCAAVGLAGYELGGPVGVYVAVVLATQLGKLISKETQLDILLTPIVTLSVGLSVAKWIGPHLDSLMRQLGDLIAMATDMQPLLMGVIVSVVVGICLTLPISSAALCAMLHLGGLAAGAATAGCCAQMIGFAVMSRKDNDLGGCLAQGLGTSMLQMPNIVRHPFIFLPPILTSAVTGPLATMVFKMDNQSVAAGMGTCGLVGPLGVIAKNPDGGLWMWLGIIFICFLLPMALTPIFALPFRKMGLIKEGFTTLQSGTD